MIVNREQLERRVFTAWLVDRYSSDTPSSTRINYLMRPDYSTYFGRYNYRAELA